MNPDQPITGRAGPGPARTDQPPPASMAPDSTHSPEAAARAPLAGGAAPLLYTPREAAALLAVPESWLRRKAGRRLIPCTFLGKHLRFSPANLAEITQTGAQGARNPRRHRRAA